MSRDAGAQRILCAVRVLCARCTVDCTLSGAVEVVVLVCSARRGLRKVCCLKMNHSKCGSLG